MAEFFQLSALQVRYGIVGSGSAEFDTAIALLGDPGFWAFGPPGVAQDCADWGSKAVGRHSGAGRGLPDQWGCRSS
jgi:hypothetical protein